MASHKVQAVNELNFDELVLKATGPVLVDFTATWCGPCKVQAKILEQLAERAGAPTIVAIDTDDCPDLAARFGVRGMPTLVMFRGGKETGRRLGLTNEQGIAALVQRPADPSAASVA
jgi:thioredoxin 1